MEHRTRCARSLSHLYEAPSYSFEASLATCIGGGLYCSSRALNQLDGASSYTSGAPQSPVLGPRLNKVSRHNQSLARVVPPHREQPEDRLHTGGAHDGARSSAESSDDGVRTKRDLGNSEDGTSDHNVSLEDLEVDDTRAPKETP